MCAFVFSLSGVVEVYRVSRRVELGIKATAVCSEKLQQQLKDISRVWNNLIGFMSLAKLAVSCYDVCTHSPKGRTDRYTNRFIHLVAFFF